MSITLINTLAFPEGRDNNVLCTKIYNNKAYVNADKNICTWPYTVDSYVKIKRIDLSTFLFDGSLNLTSTIGQSSAFALDSINGYLYCFTYVSSGVYRLHKIRLSDFTELSYNNLNLPTGVGDSGGVDSTGIYGYWTDSWDKVWKINLSTLALSATLDLSSYGDDSLYNTCIDNDNGFLYILSNESSYPNGVVKIDLSTFTRVGRINFASGWDNYEYRGCWAKGFIYNNNLYCPAYGDAYARLIKIQLSDFTRVGGLDIENPNPFAFLSVAKVCDGYAYLVGGRYPGAPPKYQYLYQIDLNSFSIKDSIQIACIASGPGFEYIASGFLDSESKHFYPILSSCYSNPAKVLKCLIECQAISAPCQHTNESTPIGGDCETFSDPTPNFSRIRSESESSNVKVSHE